MRSEGRLDSGTDDDLEAAVQALRAQQHLLERLAEAVPAGVLQVDRRRHVVFTNDRLHDILGAPRVSTLDEQLATVMDRDRTRTDTTFDVVLSDGVDRDIEVGIRPPWGEGTPGRRCILRVRALTTAGGEVTGAIVCVSDVTGITYGRDELRQRATFDSLTLCHDRASAMAALEAMLAGAEEGCRPAVIFVDLDRLEELNDGQGHDAGDEFLAVVARRLRGAVREDDLVGRIGGHKFLVVSPAIGTAAEAVRTAIRIAESLSHEIQLKSARIESRASIGVAWSSGSDRDADALVTQADTAMHESKRRGAGRPVLFTPSLLQAPPPPG